MALKYLRIGGLGYSLNPEWIYSLPISSGTRSPGVVFYILCCHSFMSATLPPLLTKIIFYKRKIIYKRLEKIIFVIFSRFTNRQTLILETSKLKMSKENRKEKEGNRKETILCLSDTSLTPQ